MIYSMNEKHIFDSKEYQVEVQFLESLDACMNYEIVKITGETMPTQNWISQNVTPVFSRKQLNNRMQEHIYKIKNPKFPFHKK
jgi:hypothetical protein